MVALILRTLLGIAMTYIARVLLEQLTMYRSPPSFYSVKLSWQLNNTVASVLTKVECTSLSRLACFQVLRVTLYAGVAKFSITSQSTTSAKTLLLIEFFT